MTEEAGDGFAEYMIKHGVAGTGGPDESRWQVYDTTHGMETQINYSVDPPAFRHRAITTAQIGEYPWTDGCPAHVARAEAPDMRAIIENDSDDPMAQHLGDVSIVIADKLAPGHDANSAALWPENAPFGKDVPIEQLGRPMFSGGIEFFNKKRLGHPLLASEQVVITEDALGGAIAHWVVRCWDKRLRTQPGNGNLFYVINVMKERLRERVNRSTSPGSAESVHMFLDWEEFHTWFCVNAGRIDKYLDWGEGFGELVSGLDLDALSKNVANQLAQETALL